MKREIEVLIGYLPAQLSDDELQKIVSETITEVGASSIKDMGKVMKEVLAKVSGQADNQMVGSLVKERLASV